MEKSLIPDQQLRVPRIARLIIEMNLETGESSVGYPKSPQLVDHMLAVARRVTDLEFIRAKLNETPSGIVGVKGSL